MNKFLELVGVISLCGVVTFGYGYFLATLTLKLGGNSFENKN